MNQNAYNQYKEVQVKTASRGKLVIMLYEGCIKFLRIARQAIQEEDIMKTNKYLKKCHDIINELKATLDFEKGGEIAENLDSLYDFMNRQLINANLHSDPEEVQVVEELMEELLEAWENIVAGGSAQEEMEKVDLTT
ncbi:MAG: flagellar export chaperone FliS [Bacillota bacterium]